MGFLEKIFGSKNERELRKLGPIVSRIGDLEKGLEAKSDAQLRAMTGDFRSALRCGGTGPGPRDRVAPCLAGPSRNVLRGHKQ